MKIHIKRIERRDHEVWQFSCGDPLKAWRVTVSACAIACGARWKILKDEHARYMRLLGNL